MDYLVGTPCGDCAESVCTMNCSSATYATRSDWIAASIWAGVFPEKATAEQVRDWKKATILSKLIVVTDALGYVTLHEPDEDGRPGDLVASIWRDEYVQPFSAVPVQQVPA